MKIVIVSEVGPATGGGPLVAIRSAIELHGRGLDVLYVSATPPDASLIQAGVPTFHLGLDSMDSVPSMWKPGEYAKYVRETESKLDTVLGKEDASRTVLHFHSFGHAIPGKIVSHTKSLGFNLVFTLHDYMTVCPNGRFFDFKNNELCRRNPFGASCWSTDCINRGLASKMGMMLRSSADKYAFRTLDCMKALVYVSNFSRDLMRIRASGREQTIYNPIDVPQEPRVAAEQNRNYLWMGRFVPEKDPLIFAKAAKELGIQAVFVGDGPLKDEIIEACPEARITGWLTGEAVRAQLRTARAVVLSSLWYETAGLVVAEALALGIPVVVPSISAACEFIELGKTGLLFEAGNIAGLVAELQKLQDDQLVLEMSVAAHSAYWKAPFTVRSHCDQLVELYGEVLNAK